MLVRRQDLGGVAHRHPADRNRGGGRDHGLDVHNPVDPHLGFATDPGPVEHRRAGGEEGSIGHGAAGQVGPGAHQDVVADRDRVSLRSADDRVLHHDAAPADHDGASFCRQDGAEEDPAED